MTQADGDQLLQIVGKALGKVCFEPFGACKCGRFETMREIRSLVAGFPATFSPIPGTLAVCRRTHACAPIRLRCAIDRLDSANSVCSCAVFFFNPR